LESRGLLNGDSQLVVQQAASGKLERVQSIFDSGKLIAWHGYEQRQEGPSGGDIAKTSILRPIVRDSVAHIGSSLAWHGALSFDYFFDERQQVAWFIDCNPRLVEPMNAFFSGINLPDILVRLSLTEKTTGLASGREGVRTHMTLMALLDAAARGGRIGLLRRLVRAFLDRDVFRNSREELTPLRLDPATVFPLVITLAFLLANPGSSAAMASYSVRSYSLSREAAKAIIGPLQCGDREERPNTR
ncbi:MAG TPA: hypothetical protein VLZ03_03790, partial [Thermodesulfobacteriota bacterium]|nr:hypothetical protein [Thermodesulfobacteriota bacterium]